MSTKPGVTASPSASIVRLPAAADPADLDDAVAFDRDVARERVGSGAVDDRSALDHQVMRHGSQRRRPAVGGTVAA